VTEADLAERNARFVDPKQAAGLMTKAERVVTF
jgi:hypothetical protein